ncbi:2TM domain-containing protein [Colwellia sp. D2M02]|uniref:2TM domain-containing protein n=1 Tax=Colwellia sp. D2M02 TaxID=2841562 RepID=UPI001C088D72|nr:2TM domain-containing protein [Colwellia sp. D2M02]MBU2893098.1 2TM domain-containing protein [Colwellia sp. D2M02]
MIVKKLRLQKSWSQEQLSQFSGLSVRTIQRIERGHQASIESLKALAAVFQIDLNDLQPEHDMNTSNTVNDNVSSPLNHQTTQLSDDERKAMKYVEGIKGFYGHLFSFVSSIIVLTLINLFLTPGYLWVLWVIFGWGIGIVSHGIQVFEVFSFFSPEWEKKQVEKRLGRKL